MSREPKPSEILDAINSFATHVEEKFALIDQRFDKMDQRFDILDTRIVRVEALMVTKDYLDDKLANLWSDMTLFVRREIARAKI